MKSRLHNLSLFSLALIFFTACSSTSKTSSSNQPKEQNIVDTGYREVQSKDVNQSNFMVNPNEEGPSNVSLGDMIRRLPGVQVSGRGNNLRIKVSGSESFNSNTDPLFVLNGVAYGNSYAQIASVVNPNEVKSISVLKGSDATIYGTRGANGVILIRTKKTR